MVLATHRRGFTLVELLVASTMMAVLIVGLSVHLRAGLEIWRRLNTDGDARQRLYVATERLERDLAQAVIIDTREEAYGIGPPMLPQPLFGASQLDWYVVYPSGPTRPNGDAAFVSYWCGESEGKHGLWRTVLSLSAARARLETTPQLLLDGCESLSVRYAYLALEGTSGLDWREQWNGGIERLPALLDVRIELSDGATLRQVLPVPAGVLVAFEDAAGT